MTDQDKTNTPGQQTVNEFGSYGLIGGIALGLIAGILISGPNFNIWPPLTSVMVTLGCAVAGGVIGFFASAIAAGAEAAGPKMHDEDSTSEQCANDDNVDNS